MEFICQECATPHSNNDLTAKQNDFDPEIIEVFILCSRCGHDRNTLVEIAEFTSEDE